MLNTGSQSLREEGNEGNDGDNGELHALILTSTKGMKALEELNKVEQNK